MLLRAAGTTAGTAGTAATAATTTTNRELERPPKKPSSSPSSSSSPSFSPVAALLESPELGITVCRGCELEKPSSSSPLPWTMPPPTEPAETGVAVEAAGCPSGPGAGSEGEEEAALFGEFEGRFGEVLAARSQGWWSRAECPVSRGVALRVAGQFWREKESLHRT